MSSRVVPAAGGLVAHLQSHAGFEEAIELPLDFVGDASLQGAEAVEVLDLGDGRPELLPRPCDGEVDVRLEPHVALLHVPFGDADEPHDPLQLDGQRPDLGGAVQVGLGHDLQQRRPGAVQIDLEKLPGRVEVLAGILFQVGAEDAERVWSCRPPRDFDEAVLAQRQIILADLIILRQIGVVVALPVPLGEWRRSRN